MDKLEKYKSVMKLYKKGYGKEGYGWVKISRRFPKISPYTIRGWIHYGYVPNRHYHLKPRLAPSPALSYILGVLAGDGFVFKHTVNKHRRRHDQCYTTALAAKDYEFVKAFMDALREIGLNPNVHAVDKRKPNWSKQWRVEATSIKFYNWHKSLDQQHIKEIAREYPADFIRGFYDSEGSLDPDRYVTMFSTNEETIRLVKSILAELSFTTNVRADRRLGRLPVYCIRVLGGIKASNKFCETIHPSIPRKSDTRRKWSSEGNCYVRPAETEVISVDEVK